MPDFCPDIQTEADVKKLVDAFYDKVNADALLAPVFNEFAHVDWPTHLPRMYDFWSSLLLHTARYQGQPFLRHLPLPIAGAHFERWLALFRLTVEELFFGPVADEAKLRLSALPRFLRLACGRAAFQYCNPTFSPMEFSNGSLLAGAHPRGDQSSSTAILLKGEHHRVLHKRFEPGQGMPPHLAPNDVLVVVLSGEMAITVGGLSQTYVAGDYVRFPAGAEHGLLCQQKAQILIYL